MTGPAPVPPPSKPKPSSQAWGIHSSAPQDHSRSKPSEKKANMLFRASVAHWGRW